MKQSLGGGSMRKAQAEIRVGQATMKQNKKGERTYMQTEQ
jgi:hypothetical protein